MNTSIHQYVIDQLQARKGTWPTIARESGVPRKTVEKIATQTTPNPGVKTVEQLANYFRGLEAKSAA